MKNNKLTIILTIAGRETFTQRWLKYMNENGCPYKILIGDNKNDPFFDDPKKIRECYPRLKCNYIRYNSSVSINSYFKKLESLVKMVDTKYVLFADNDDFNILDHFDKYIDFLDTNPDFVSVRGSAAKFFICSRFGTKPLNLSEGDNYIAFNVINKTIEQSDQIERVKWFLENIETADVFFNWYSIARTQKVNEVLGMLGSEEEMDPFLYELFFLVLMLNSGKIKVFPELVFLRQEGSSQALASLIADHPHAFRRIFIENKWQALYNIVNNTFVDKKNNLIIRNLISQQLEAQITIRKIRLSIFARFLMKIKINYYYFYSLLYKFGMFFDCICSRKKYIKSAVLDNFLLSQKNK